MPPIAMIGDSHSQILFPLLGTMLTAQGSPTVARISKPGWDIAKFLAEPEVLDTVYRSGAKHVIISLGGNNQTLSDAYYKKLGEFITRLRARGIDHIFWIGPLQADNIQAAETAKRHDWTRDALARWLPSYQVAFLDPYGHGDLTGSRDGVHLTTSAYRELARWIEPHIAAWLKTDKTPTQWLLLSIGVAMTVLTAAWSYRKRLSN